MEVACAILLYVVCPAPNILPLYLINDTVFEKQSLNIKCVLRIFLHLLSGIFLIIRRTGREMIKNLY
jgi:hypothetical protein